MAERRMFAKTIIDSDAFIDMPVTARLLYYDLAMRADDDGFINSPKKIMRMIGASQDDLNILILKKFIIPFDTGIAVIKHWRIHNYIRKDMYHETKYKEEKEALALDENNAYTLTVTDTLQSCNEVVAKPSTQVRLGKDRLGKDRLGKSESTAPKEEKHKHGEYGHVLLKESELEKLRAKYGTGLTEDSIRFLDEYIEMKGAKYKSHYLAIQKWVVDAVNERKSKVKPNSAAEQLQESYDMFAEWVQGKEQV